MTSALDRRMALRPGVQLVTGRDSGISLLHGGRHSEAVGVLTQQQRAVLRALAAGECAQADLDALGGPAAGPLVRRLHAGGWLIVHYGFRGRRLVTVRPVGPLGAPGPHRGPPAHTSSEVRLSRFAVLRGHGGALVLESPLSRAVFEVHSPEAMALLHALAGGPEPVDLVAPVRTGLLALLARYGFLDDATAQDRPELATEQWGPHELWFHRGSRAGHHDLPYGATGWAEGRFPPLPARREPWPGPPVPLPVPAADALEMPLGTVLRTRRSLRTADDDAPLTLAGLGEFLHLSASADGGQGQPLRASPSGGALHALELYPVVRTVDGLPAGMYHYDPYGHLLEPVPARPATVRRLLADASAAAGGATPQVLLVVSARFGRVMWKYRSMAYALVLKDLGALLQTMYLVATAAGLAPCALGTGDADLFALATGLDPLVESSVGEFILSSRHALR